MRLVATLLLFLVCGSSAADILTGRIVGVHDGDTVTLLDAGQIQYRIRLSQIDAPEIGHGRGRAGQPFAQRSKQSLSELVYDQAVRADCKTRDKYGRQVCTVWVGTIDANLEQVRRGMAWVYRKYARDSSYYQAEEEAKGAKRGLWIDPGAIPPWEWRHR